VRAVVAAIFDQGDLGSGGSKDMVACRIDWAVEADIHDGH
jgi:hypothetical protein